MEAKPKCGSCWPKVDAKLPLFFSSWRYPLTLRVLAYILGVLKEMWRYISIILFHYHNLAEYIFWRCSRLKLKHPRFYIFSCRNWRANREEVIEPANWCINLLNASPHEIIVYLDTSCHNQGRLGICDIVVILRYRKINVWIWVIIIIKKWGIMINWLTDRKNKSVWYFQFKISVIGSKLFPK